MKFLKVLAIIILISFTQCVQEEDKVLVLDDANFEEEVQKHEYLLVEFYAPWCGHCKTLAPEYAKAAEILRSDQLENKIYLAKVDATISSELAKKYSVEGFPTIKFFKDGEFLKDYDGGRTASEIVNWIKKRTGPLTRELKSVEDVESFKKESDVVVIFFGVKDSKVHKTFVKTAEKFEDVQFGYVNVESADNPILENYEIKQNQILLFKNFDEGRNKFMGEIEEEALTHFVNYFSLPLISKFDERSAEAIFGRNKSGLFLVRSQKNEEHKQYVDILRPIAEKYREKLIFIVTDIVGEIEEKLAEYFGLTEDNLPHIRIVDVKGEEDVRNYVLKDPINEENLDKFINDFFEDKLTIYVKSEEIPEVQNEPVIKVVAKNYREIVFDTSKNVLVEYYAPWCGHCKSLEPIYNKLAEHFRNDTSIVIAKIDHTQNDIEDLTLEGYPTIKFYLARDKSVPADYLGDRSFKDLVKFVNDLVYPGRQTEEIIENVTEPVEEENLEDADENQGETRERVSSSVSQDDIVTEAPINSEL